MNIYSDEALQAELTSGLRGYARRAQILLNVPEENRAQIVADEHRIMNNIPSRATEALLLAIQNSKVGK